MIKTVLLYLMVVFASGGSAVPVYLPPAEELTRRVDNAGWKGVRQESDFVKDLAGKHMDALAVDHFAKNAAKKYRGHLGKGMPKKMADRVSRETHEKKGPVLESVLREFPGAVKELKENGRIR